MSTILILLAAVHAETPHSLAQYSKRCESGVATACNNAGVMAYKKHKIKEAKEFYKQACDLGLGVACSNYGCFMDPYSKCEKGGEPTNLKAATVYYERACSKHATEGCYNYGLTMRAAGMLDDSLIGFALGCSFGDKDSCVESKGKRSMDITEVTERVLARDRAKTKE